MKIGILTYHKADNYGSVLQAYSLQTFLNEEMNFETELIDFVTSKQFDMYRNSIHRPFTLKNIAKTILNICIYNRYRTSKINGFDEFRNSLFHLSNKQYNEMNYKIIGDDYDIIICGSDQIWNMDAYDFHGAYLLENINSNNLVKISYAASLGGYDSIRGNVDKCERLRSNLNNFNIISVREISGKRILDPILDKKIDILLDPVFLLDSCAWNRLVKDCSVIKDNYIFFYSIDYNEAALNIVKKISKKVNLKVIVMYTSNKTIRVKKYGFKIAQNKSPSDFLNYIKNAKMVLTTSFHGTAFSIIYKSLFWVIRGVYDGKINEDDRMTMVLQSFELQERNIDSYSWKNKDLLEIVDYDISNKVISENLCNAQKFLEPFLLNE